MNQSKKSEVFRLAAVLYADNNYEVNPITIHRKIIESVFLDNKNAELTIHQIVEHIETFYGFIFDFDEVSDLVLKGKDEFFLIGKNHSVDLTVSLHAKRLRLLTSKVSSNNIDFFINQFIVDQKDINKSYDAKAIIYQFLYEIFSNNISSFAKLIDYKTELETAIDMDFSFNPDEKLIINSFLKWDNDGKNKAIFDISSYALEYCLVTNQSSGKSFHLQNLRNKDFYLDTNVLFRAIGINGENRKKRTTTFLNKFIEAGEILIISRFTEAEYKSTVKYYINEITRRDTNRVNPKVFSAFRKQSDFFDFYHQWRIGRQNDNIKLFEAHLLAEYENLKKTFKIKEDYNIPFNDQEEGLVKRIDELAKDIYSFKNSESSYYGRFETALTDAKNIYLIKERRAGLYKNIFETKYFFISSDQGLRRWDFKQSLATPMVLLPSQWMSILLRYLNRTSDDFKSFVSFLNLPQNETSITNEKLQLILIGISEITQDFEQQSSIVQVIINSQLQLIFGKNLPDEEVIANSRRFASTKLEQDLKDATEVKEIALDVLEAHKTGARTAIFDLEAKNQEVETKAKRLEQENNNLKQNLRTSLIEGRIRTWQIWAYIAILLVILCVLFYIQLFLWESVNYNLPALIARWIDKMPESSTKREVAAALYLVPIGCIIPLFVIIQTRLFSKNAKVEMIKKIEQELDN